MAKISSRYINFIYQFFHIPWYILILCCYIMIYHQFKLIWSAWVEKLLKLYLSFREPQAKIARNPHFHVRYIHNRYIHTNISNTDIPKKDISLADISTLFISVTDISMLDISKVDISKKLHLGYTHFELDISDLDVSMDISTKKMYPSKNCYIFSADISGFWGYIHL